MDQNVDIEFFLQTDDVGDFLTHALGVGRRVDLATDQCSAGLT